MTLDLFIRYPGETVASAEINGNYRYRLTRQWGIGVPMLFVMLNPSTADAEVDDPTIRRCMGFARREECYGIVVVNLFALRVTRPVHLYDGSRGEPNGPHNLTYVDGALYEARQKLWPTVCAWGAAKHLERSDVWRAYFRDWQDPHHALQCLGVTADGSPKHPLYLRADAPLIPWRQNDRKR
jgi:hypothetical protein